MLCSVYNIVTLCACQCLMQLCDECVGRHNSNSVLATHQLISVTDNQAVLAMFCTKHRQQPIRYFCSVCHVTLCSICTIEHDPSHKPEALEQGVIQKYRCVLLWFYAVLCSCTDGTNLCHYYHY